MSIGWDTSISSIATFNFLIQAKESMPKNSVLLDLGAGQSRFRFFFEHCNYIAIDFAGGDSKWDYSNLDIIGNVSALYFIKDNSVDFCLSTVVLEHLSEPSDFFAHVQRILKPGGKLFLYVPFYAEEHQQPYDFFRYTSFGLKHLCTKNHLLPVSITASDRGCHGIMRYAHIALKNMKIKPSKIPLNIALGNLEYENEIIGKLKALLMSVFPEFLNYHFKKNATKLLFSIADFLLVKILMPLFDYFDINFESNMYMPGLWYLVALKEGEVKIEDNILNNKQEIIKSIVCCPKCKSEILFENHLCECTSCKTKFEYNNGQINFSFA